MRSGLTYSHCAGDVLLLSNTMVINTTQRPIGHHLLRPHSRLLPTSCVAGLHVLPTAVHLPLRHRCHALCPGWRPIRRFHGRANRLSHNRPANPSTSVKSQESTDDDQVLATEKLYLPSHRLPLGRRVSAGRILSRLQRRHPSHVVCWYGFGIRRRIFSTVRYGRCSM